MAAAWLPLEATLTLANRFVNEAAPVFLGDPPAEVRFVLGDRYNHLPDLGAGCTAGGRVPVAPAGGLVTTDCFAFDAVFVYQLTLLHRFEAGRDLRVGLDASLQTAEEL